MKRILYFISLCLLPAAVMWSCSDDGEDRTGLVNNGLKMAVSSRVAAFDAGGGSVSLAVLWNGDKTNIISDSWIKAGIKDNELTLEASPNTEGASRFFNVMLFAESSGSVAKDSVYVFQKGRDIANLSAAGLANCYIAKTGGDYMFRADIKGNGTANDGNSRYLEKYGLEIAKATNADLLWEATFDADKNRSRRIIEIRPVYIDGYVYFSTGTEEGNAVIAVKDKSGNVLWSWHIWVVSSTPGTSKYNGIEWMARNLGAINNTPGDVSNRGLLYQWGRKDPFLPSKMQYMVTEFDNWAQANYHNLEKGKGSAEWNFGYNARMMVDDPGNIQVAVRQPTWFLGTEKAYDWYVMRASDSDLWGDAQNTKGKTIFDPCPAGYKVPPGGAWGTEQDGAWGPDDNNGRRWTGGTGDYYPLPGHLVYNNGRSAYCGSLSCYWTSAPVGESQFANRLYLGIDRCSYANIGRGYGGSIRCVKGQ